MENLNLIGQSAAGNYIVTLKEININFIINESQLFHFDFQPDENIINSFNKFDDAKCWEMTHFHHIFL